MKKITHDDISLTFNHFASDDEVQQTWLLWLYIPIVECVTGVECWLEEQGAFWDVYSFYFSRSVLKSSHWTQSSSVESITVLSFRSEY